jgi:hypothetical protein
MSLWAICFAVLVGALNIAFNRQTRESAVAAVARGASWTEGLITFDFLAAFLIGCVSLLVLYSLYREGILLARGILLMGAVSIVGGTLYGILVQHNRPSMPEYVLLALMAVFFLFSLATTNTIR